MNRILVCFGLILAVNTIALAQVSPDVQQGLTQYGTYQNGAIDSVDELSGNVMVRIPLLSYSQKGGHLDLSWFAVANTKIWHVYTSGTSRVWHFAEPGIVIVPSHGKTGTSSLLRFMDSNGDRVQVSLINITTSDGSTHEIVPTDGSPMMWNFGESVDATGYKYSTSSGAFWDNSGTQYTLSGLNTIPDLSGSYTPDAVTSATDSNGNEITYGSGGWTDTIGRVIPGYPTTGSYRTAPGVSSTTAGCPSGTVAALDWNVPAFNGSTATYIFCYANFSYSTHFAQTGITDVSGTVSLISAIVLPDSSLWEFNYDSYLALTSVTFPTGGTLSYTYSTATLSTNSSRVVSTRALDANDGAGSHTTTYQWNALTSAGSNVATDPDGNDTAYTPGSGGITQIQTYSGSVSTGTLLKTLTRVFNSMTDPLVEFDNGGGVNVVPLSETVTWPGGQTSQTTNTFDPGFTWYSYDLTTSSGTSGNAYYGVPVQQTATDYGSGTPGSLLRTTTTAYQFQSSSSYLNNNLLNFPASVQVSGAGPGSYTTYGYDETGCLAGTCGDLTSVHRWLNTTGGYLVTTNTYDSYGRITSTVDPKSNPATTYAYSSCYAGSGPTSVTNALSQSTSYCYDYNTGLPTSTTDPNSQTTSTTYDSMLRTSTITYPDGGQTIFSYPSATEVQISEKIDATPRYKTSNLFVDGLGRLSQTQLTSDPDGTDYTLTQYDALGRKYRVYNPTRCSPITTNCGESTWGYTTYSYDPLNQPLTVTEQDGSVVSTTYSGPCATVADEASKTRQSCTDGLGRLASVIEDPSGFNYTTTYTYDALDDLTGVAQGSQTRTFSYDSLSHLTSSANPESGTVNYTYDADGNEITKTDARSITTCFGTWTGSTCYPNGYDALNRLTIKSYSDGSRAMYYQYDTCPSWWPSCGLTNLVGRLVEAKNDCAGSHGCGTSTVSSYDAMGRVVYSWQQTPPTAGGATVQYLGFDLVGNLDSLTYPSGETVTFTANGANEPVSAIDSGASINYATSAAYGPAATLASLNNGSYLLSSFYYNSRLQPCRIAVNSSGTAPSYCADSSHSGNVMDFTYNFNAGSSDNGNVMGITNGIDSTRSETFNYDALNRILTAAASNYATSPAHCWGESYYGNIDRYGNLSGIYSISSAYTGCYQEYLNLAVSTTTNRITTSGFTYDSAGNETSDGTNSPTYDGESHMISDAGVTYTYDAFGHRVTKSSGTSYIYGQDGQVTAEINSSGNVTNEYIYFGGKRIARRDSSGNVYYYFADHLGTSRVITNSSGTVCYDADFYPFGGERPPYTDTCDSHYKFTGKERDSESGLDNFGARYDSSQYGRFMTPDWSAKAEPVPYSKLDNPQSLNLYSYVLNNPLSNVDTDGHACSGVLGNTGTGFCTRATEYGQFDANPNIQSQTRFFGAANAVSQALADVAVPLVSPVSQQTANFLEGVGQNLEKLNQQEVSAIQNGSLSGPNLDQQLVHNEQSSVQEQLNNLQQSNPAAYSKTITEINGALNPGTVGQVASTIFSTDKAYAGVLAGVRKDLGRNIDFSNQSDREAIGNAVINHVRQTGGCDINGKRQPGC